MPLKLNERFFLNSIIFFFYILNFYIDFVKTTEISEYSLILKKKLEIHETKAGTLWMQFEISQHLLSLEDILVIFPIKLFELRSMKRKSDNSEKSCVNQCHTIRTQQKEKI